MGFLKFLKREKKKEDLDEFDLPPAPPPLEGFDDNLEMPDFPDFDKEKISVTDDELSKFDFPEIGDNVPDIGTGYETQDFPDFSEMEEKQLPLAPLRVSPTIPEQTPLIWPVSQPQQQTQEIKEEQPSIAPSDFYPKKERRLFSPEKAIRERPNVKTVYVRVDNFKATLGSINIVRNDLKKSEELLMKLESIKNSKDKSFDKMKSSLEDLQHKLIFIDKTLFKGDGN